MKVQSLIQVLIVTLMMCAGVSAYAETDPLWLELSEKSLNAKATNSTYRFKILHTYGPSRKLLVDNSLYALEKYVKDSYMAVPSSVKIDEVSGGNQPTYFVNFRMPDSSEDNFIVARLVDSYAKFEDYALNEYQYEYYQLYALSNLNEYPEYDDFTLTKSYNAKATALSIIPGMGQFYKGQRTKGYLILGGEIGFITAALVFENQRRYAQKQSETVWWGEAPSWRSKMVSYRNFRNGAIGCAAAVYIYNIIDAATSQGGRMLQVRKPWGSNLSLTPWATPDFAGVSLSLSF